MKNRELAKELKNLALLQLQTGSDDAYGQGLYNGLLLAASRASGQGYYPLSLSAFRYAQRRARERIGDELRGHKP